MRGGLPKQWRLGVGIFAVISLLTGCGPVLEPLFARLTPSPVMIAPTEPVVAAETPTAQPVSCAFVWSNRPLPEVSTLVNQAFRKVGLVEVEVEASGYGEDCIDTDTNRVVYSLVKQTDFYFLVAVENVNDPQFIGEWVERIALIMEDFQPGMVPGPNPGYFGINFSNGSETVYLWVPRTRINNLLDEGVTGGDLFEALQDP